MKKNIKNVICVVLVAAIVLSSCFMLFACNKDKGQNYDPETRPITFAISALDGTFNPFFTTSATDSEIANFTQVGMFSTNNDGLIDCGEHVPTVVLDYKITSYDENGVKTTDNVDHTTYEFVIKNGIKFSDGQPLTIDDVLFNLYVYLDPMYSGSSTVYSVDIQGLKAYRYNDATLDDSYDDSDLSFRNRAQQRINKLVSWSRGEDGVVLTEEMQADIEKVKARFLKDLSSEWTSNEGTIESNYKEYSFREDWESYYFIEGIVQLLTEKNSQGYDVAIKDANGKYVTELNVQDANDNWVYDENHKTDLAQQMYDAYSNETTIAQYMEANKCDRARAIELIKKDTAIKTVYDSYATESAIRKSLETILLGMTTGSNIAEDWTLEEQSKYYQGQSESVKSISGITTKKVSNFEGEFGVKLTEQHDVLSITINGIDPKAIWNFAFVVAPMHYYSDAETIANKTDYPYGVRPRDKDFFDNVLNSPEKGALPVGAGAYRASNQNGNASSDPSQVNAKDFWSNKKVYFERNDYFYTLGSGISNAKIRRLTYVEVSENNILNNLLADQIDYGTPSATPYNKSQIAQDSSLGSIEYKTSGYGYIGINPKYVPDIEVRRAIMMAFNTESIIKNYYGGTMAENIYRPMSKLSWAYPENCTPYYEYDPSGIRIEEMVESAGYIKDGNGKYYHPTTQRRLKYKFTIAGDTTDHPAYSMFEAARQLLNAHGFDITVGTDVQALKKLSTGGLEVWAAAWTSTIDPDMYQIYHKDSQTTNVKNWNYDEILNTNKYPEEKIIVNDLSDLIDQGRETNNQKDRADIYSQALDKIMELAVEFPTYQRKDLAVYNKDVIDASTLNTSDNLKYSGPTDRIWELNYN